MFAVPKLLTRPVAPPETTAKKKKTATKRKAAKVNTVMNARLGAVMTVAIVAAQAALVWRPLLGAYITAATLVALLALSLKFEQTRKLAIAFAVLPTSMLVLLTMSQPDAFARSTAFYDMLLLFALLYGYTFSLDEPRSALSFRKKYLMFLPLMVVLGQALGALGFGMLRHTYPYNGTPLFLVAGMAIVFAIAEELLFRGLIQRQAAKIMHPVVAAVLATVAYTVIFVAHGSYVPAVFALISGAVLSGVYYFKQNLVLTTTLNAVMKLSYVGLLATFVLR